MKPKILLWGGRSQARIASRMIEEQALGEVSIIFDTSLETPYFKSNSLFINDVEVLKANLSSITHFIVCIAGEYGYARVTTAEYLSYLGIKPLDLIHQTAFIDQTSDIGIGAQIMPSATIHKFCKIGTYSIINTNATIDHECEIGNGVHVMGGASIAGKVQIDDHVTIGTNATILPSIGIGEGAIIGAGAVVTRDILPYEVVVGVPAKKLRETKPFLLREPLDRLIG